MIKMQELREAKGLSQRGLARKTQPEIDPSYICKAERRGLQLGENQASRIAAVLEWQGDPAELFEEVDE